MNYSEIVVLLGNKCTSECDICCIKSNMDCDEKLSRSRIKEFILSSKDNENIRVFNFSGGEAFLYYDTLLELVRCCKDVKKHSTVITNAYWANDYETTVYRLKELKEAGLGSVGLSYDEFHQKYVNVKNIRNVLKAAKKLDMKTGIQSVILNGDNNYGWIDQIGKELVDVPINFLGCDPVGRAKELIGSDRFIRENDINGCVCRKGGTLSVSYDGKVWPCCSPYVFSLNICVGNVYDDIKTVGDALNNLEKNIILKILRNKGFNFFIEIVKENELVEIPDKIISSCELCQEFFNPLMLKKMHPFIIEKLSKDPACRITSKRHIDEI